jgi:uncharacterized protein
VATGLIALLDDVAAIAKVAAASIDDVGAQATRAGVKAAGIIIDDAAVTPRYVVGFAADRELPIVGRIAVGSLKNKLIFLLPAALLLSLLAPWLITPLLMVGGAYLCYEGAEKVYETLFPHQAHHHEEVVRGPAETPQQLEDKTVAGAIKTDFILSAEIMAITLATLPDATFWGQAVVLAVVGLGITLLVYGGVALIVKADDAGVAMAQSRTSGLVRSLGRGLVVGMPYFLKLLSIVGTAAMIWVGGGIIIHGLEEYHLSAPGHAMEAAAEAAAHALPAIGGLASWLMTALVSLLFGLVVGVLLIPLVQHVAAPLYRRLRGSPPGEATATQASPGAAPEH